MQCFPVFMKGSTTMSVKNRFINCLSSVLPGDPAIMRVLSGPLRGTKICARFNIRPHYLLGRYEHELTDAILANLAPGKVAFDIGANVGFVSLLMAKAVSSDSGNPGAVYAFEPSPLSFRMLATNSLINPQWNIQPFQVALSDTSGIVEFSSFDYDVVSRLGDHRSRFADAEVTYVRVDTLDNIIRNFHLPPPVFVKIDVEGAELKVLRGMQCVLGSYQPTLLIEVHGLDGNGDTGSDFGDAIVAFLKSWSYRCEYIQHQFPRQLLCTSGP